MGEAILCVKESLVNNVGGVADEASRVTITDLKRCAVAVRNQFPFLIRIAGFPIVD